LGGVGVSFFKWEDPPDTLPDRCRHCKIEAKNPLQ
jgi:hypothetical protein